MALTDNQEAYYKLDGDLTDSASGFGTLTNSGALYTASGKINGAYDFSDDIMQVPATWSAGQNVSVSCWVKSDSWSARGIWDFETTDTFFGLDFYTSNTGQIRVFTSADGSVTSGATMSIGVWHHLVLVMNSGAITIYLDNTPILTHTSTQALNNTNKFVIGGQYSGTSSSGKWDGLIDEVGVWSRALSVSEVSQLYNSGAGLQYPYGVAAEEDNATFFGGGLP